MNIEVGDKVRVKGEDGIFEVLAVSQYCTRAVPEGRPLYEQRVFRPSSLIPLKEDKPIDIPPAQLLCFPGQLDAARRLIEADKPEFKEGDRVGTTIDNLIAQIITFEGDRALIDYDNVFRRLVPISDLIPAPPKTETPIMVCVVCGLRVPCGCPPQTEELTMRVKAISQDHPTSAYQVVFEHQGSELMHFFDPDEARSIHIGDEYVVTIQRKD